MNPTSAKADGAAFMNGLAPGPRQVAMYCQSQLRRQLGGKVYVVAAPSLQSAGLNTASAAAVPVGGTTVVYDLVKDGRTTTASSTCAPDDASR